MRDGVLTGAVGLNRSFDVRAVRKLIAHGITPPVGVLTDADVELESLVPVAEAVGEAHGGATVPPRPAR
jgi:hypothetical protein